MLWFDNDRRKDLNSKVIRAADYYREKYGRVPNICFVHPSMLSLDNGKNGSKAASAAKKVMAGKVEILPADTVLPNHLWIGVNGQN
jgi:hypothetical protein